MTFGKW